MSVLCQRALRALWTLEICHAASTGLRLCAADVVRITNSTYGRTWTKSDGWPTFRHQYTQQSVFIPGPHHDIRSSRAVTATEMSNLITRVGLGHMVMWCDAQPVPTESLYTHSSLVSCQLMGAVAGFLHTRLTITLSQSSLLPSLLDFGTWKGCLGLKQSHSDHTERDTFSFHE